jgi:diaminopimelate decarboxylase
VNFHQLADTYGTPLYVYDFEHYTQQYNALKEAFKARKSLISYAVKANSNLSVIKHFESLGAGADCVSIGEVRRALMCGISPYKIIFSGVGKRDDEIKEALESNILFINAESEEEVHRIEMIAESLNIEARISLRVNPNIDPQTHPYISTGLSENKFGIDIESAKRLYIKAHNSKHLNPIGIHFHIGSQLTQLTPIRESAAIVAELVRSLEVLNIEIKFFDIGGGLGVAYDDEILIKPYDYAQAILDQIKGLDVTVMMEPGRFLTANGGYFLTKVLYEKMTGDKRFVIVDGAMNDLLRPSLYDAYHEVELLAKNEGEKTKADIVGPVCESGDFFVKDYLIAPTKHNDLIVVKSAGAYGMVMSSNYNTRGRPAEVAIEGEEDRLIRRRETFEDIIASEEELMRGIR